MSQIIINGQPLYQVDLPEMTLAQWQALPVAERPKEWIRTDAEYTDIPAENVELSDGTSVQDAIDVELNVDVQYTNSNITIAEYFRYHRFGKMVVVDIGGMKTSNTAEQVIATSNLPIMRTRPVAVMFSNRTGSSQERGFLYGAIGYSSFTVAIPTANTTMYAQFVYFTD